MSASSLIFVFVWSEDNVILIRAEPLATVGYLMAGAEIPDSNNLF